MVLSPLMGSIIIGETSEDPKQDVKSR